VEFGARYTNAGAVPLHPVSFTINATGNINIADGAQIQETVPENVTFSTTGTGSIYIGDGKGNPIVINLGAGNLSISAQDSSPGTGGSIYLNDANICAAGGNMSVNATGTLSAVNTIFNGALNGGGGSVSLTGLGTSSAAADMNGVYLSGDTIEVAGGIQSSTGSSNGGNLTINGTAPLNLENGSAIGVNISNTSLNGQVSNGSIVINGQGGNAATVPAPG